MAFPPLEPCRFDRARPDGQRPWYKSLLGMDPLVDEHTETGYRHLVWQFGNGSFFGTHEHDHAADGDRFSEFRCGLDHVAFGCATREELEEWVHRLAALDPDGIALEFFVTR